MREFLSKAGTIAKDTAGLAADKTGEVVEIAKVKAKIHSAKTEIKNNQRQIGEFYFNQYLAGGKVDKNVHGFCDEIQNQLDLIDELEEQLKKE